MVYLAPFLQPFIERFKAVIAEVFVGFLKALVMPIAKIDAAEYLAIFCYLIILIDYSASIASLNFRHRLHLLWL